MTKNKAFTLSELLVALGVLGVIAGLVIPATVKNINEKVFTTGIKNITGSVQQLASDKMIENKTKSLLDTIFASSNLLSNGFTWSKSCETATSGCLASSYRNINGENIESSIFSSYSAIKLKNGAAIAYLYSYSSSTDKVGTFIVDVNGEDNPNVAGRDLYAFDIDVKGEINGTSTGSCTAATSIADLKNCFYRVMDNNWKMNY